MANGVLVIDKPQGWTSHDVVARVRRLLHERRTGHGGTLDPMATGVLPVFVGRATRAVSYVMDGEKEYLAGLQLGVITDTQDTTGQVLERRAVEISREDVEQARAPFRGAIMQLPPMYSALKRDGKKLYELAREGVEVERQPRPVTIHALELLEVAPQEAGFVPGPDIGFLRVRCSKGTYVRTLCHDIGQALGCGGAMCALRRTWAGGFSLQSAVSLEALAQAAEEGGADQLLRPVDACFSAYPALNVDAKAQARIYNGTDFPWDATPGLCRVYGPNGDFRMLGESRNGRMYTVKSFFEV